MIGHYKLKTFTSESVSEGHPDKICDQISDAVLDEYLLKDPDSKVACEVMATKNNIIVGGEIDSFAKDVNLDYLVRKTLLDIGYNDEEKGIDANNCNIINLINNQSSDIKNCVDKGNEIGAGDQGIMFGYADNSNDYYMPLPIIIAHQILKRSSSKRRSGSFKYSRPDMKTQVTIDYENMLIDNVVISVQHDENYKKNEFEKYIKEDIVDNILKKFGLFKEDYPIYINTAGRFVCGGPAADAGLTGRKIIVDTYGGYIPHGGGAFSGKDATKVDRSGAYMARFLAKNIVASGSCDKCQIQLAYAIGLTQPVSLLIETFGTEKVDVKKLGNWILKNIDLSPKGIIDLLNLKKPIYQKTACYGHFGRKDFIFPWEELTIKKFLTGF